jgi:hypothetical protein
MFHAVAATQRRKTETANKTEKKNQKGELSNCAHRSSFFNCYRFWTGAPHLLISLLSRRLNCTLMTISRRLPLLLDVRAARMDYWIHFRSPRSLHDVPDRRDLIKSS